ncbi:MAG TPA: hypothetical protein VKE70_26975, partial [Candidatus Solibacter sp.]|nr:hypothetical protein [Candidatus Solibacter sp.]
MPLKSLRAFSFNLILCATAGAQLAQINSLPSRIVGQPIMKRPNPLQVPTSRPNLVEGREFFFPAAVAVDTSVSPNILYVADTGNNRILAWRNAASFNNGAPANLVIGQTDFYSTDPLGPGTAFSSTGLSAPSGVAVLNGDLYVADSGNHRVLRFRAPFGPAGVQTPDLCLGQPNFASKVANAPTGLISEKGLNSPGALRFDRAGNLWVADFNNNRVLEFVSADIARPASPFGIAAKLEIGQLDMISKADPLPNTVEGQQRINQIGAPSSINFDSAGRLYIGDVNNGFSRVLVFQPTFTSGQGAVRIMGFLPPLPQGSQPRPDKDTFSVVFGTVSDIFFLPGTQGVGILDAGFHRIMVFPTFDNWPDVATAFSPSAIAIVGHASGITGINQRDQKSLVANDGNPTSSASSLSSPQGALLVNNELYVADAGNHRVIVMPLSGGTFQAATRLLGQDRYDSNAPNLIEGREFDFVASSSVGTLFDGGLAIDSTSDTPHLYVADAYNNRVLGFKDIRTLTAGKAADIVIGQPDFATKVCNYGSTDPANAPLQNSLCRPTGLLADANGNLYVADSGNGRVLRFPAPFSHAGNQVADLVLGQPSFFIKLTDPSASTMLLPYGLAFAGSNGLLVSDQGSNRVLYFPFTSGGFTSADNGKAATKVLGQSDFISIGSSKDDTGMASPRHIASDTDGRVYIADTGNNRILIFDQITRQQTAGSHPAQILTGGFNSATGMYVNPVTGELWVGDLTGAKVVKFPKFDTLIFNPAPTSTTIPSLGPVAVIQDQYGDLVVAESVNRVAFYFPGLTALNGGSFSTKNLFLAPNTFATLYPATGGTFGKDTQDINGIPNPIPLPKALGDVQVLFDGLPAPMTYASPSQINFIVPWSAPTTSFSDLQVVQV